MFCPKCGSNVEEGNKVCTNCGLDFSTIKQEDQKREPVPVLEKGLKKLDGLSNDSIIKYVYFGLAGIVLIMFFMAASSITAGGNEIMQIQSVGGKTLEEAYYAELGLIYAGYAMIARALGIFFASVLAWLGLKK